MGNKKAYLLRLTLMFSDFIIVNFSYLISYVILFAFKPSTSGIFHLREFLLFNILWLLLAEVFKLYHSPTLSNIENVFRQTGKIYLSHLACMILLHFVSWNNYWLMGGENSMMPFLPVCYGILITLFAVSRLFLTYISEFVFRKVRLHKKIAILGYNETGMQLANYFNENRSIYSFQGFFDDGRKQMSVDENGNIRGSIDNCIDFVVENNIREIYSTFLPDQHTDVSRLMEVAEQNCVRIKFVASADADVYDTNYHVEYFDDIPVISLRTEPLQDMRNRVKKRLFDIVFSSFVIVFVLSWLMPLIALLIKLESKGPVLFRQQRSGRDNMPFWCYKFRSMAVNEHSDALQASKGDRRITKVGAFLRKSSLDEFPQFFNVFAGDMSIVGPRPHMLKHTEQYSTLISKYMVRQFLKPGITGWAQVNGYRGETKDTTMMEKRVEYDIWYMENWSIMLDIRIIFMTIINIFKGEENAY